MVAFRPLRPLKVEEISPTELAIDWADGHRSYHRYRTLRFFCYCAGCRDEQTGRALIRMEAIPEDIHPVRIDPVGAYALRFNWSDGHNTGIYSYDHLRKICECPECETGRKSEVRNP